jgi:hypothetical protein
MPATTPFIHRNLPRLLLQAREAVMLHTRPSLRGQGLSDQQWRVLRVLGEHAGDPGGLETGRVAREAYLLGPSLTGVLTRMERDGLISRMPLPGQMPGAPWCALRRKGWPSCKRCPAPSRRTTPGSKASWAKPS